MDLFGVLNCTFAEFENALKDLSIASTRLENSIESLKLIGHKIFEERVLLLEKIKILEKKLNEK